MLAILTALLVLMFFTFKFTKLEHPENILQKLVALDVSQLDISIFSKLVQS